METFRILKVSWVYVINKRELHIVDKYSRKVISG